MKDDFYTFGGGHFWEDLFFYQKWRIQRNYVTKKCRLLDNWDIRRHEGSFEECRKAFVNYIEAHQIARQKGHMVVMIHSIGQPKNIFKPLWRKVLSEGMLAAAVNYPSTQKPLSAHVKQFHFFLNHLEDVDKVSFVTYGAGNLLLQALFKEKAEWQKKLELGRVVEVSPYTYGSKLWNKLGSMKLIDFVVGPMAKDLSPKKVALLPQITAMETGIISTGRNFVETILEMLTRTTMPYHSLVEVKKDAKAKSIIEIDDNHFNVFKNPEVCEKVALFLKKGVFD